MNADNFLDGRVKILQPEKGYRAGIEPVLLAASLQVQSGEHVLDLGTGVATALCCLGARVPDVQLHGIEIDAELIQFAQSNITNNNLTANLLHGDLVTECAHLPPHSIHHVMVNPPFYDEAGAASPNAQIATAKMAHDGLAAAWIKAVMPALSAQASFTAILPPSELPTWLEALAYDWGAFTILPLWPRTGTPAKRLILTARRQRKTPLSLLPGLVLHNADNSFTPEAQDVLRHGKALNS